MKLVQQVVAERVAANQNETFDRVELDKTVAWSKRGRMYDNKHVTWGQVEFMLSSSESPDRKRMVFRFIAENVEINLRKLSLHRTEEEGHDTLEHSGDDEIKATKVIKLAFFI